ncbi:hypothetical protein BDV93DRAFT_550748 [Ceratobasidium sp. AG-I]|nr:hypothetical protein BDV93DRAFT_550748 [Ceratobasidium sp. AG-I]
MSEALDASNLPLAPTGDPNTGYSDADMDLLMTSLSYLSEANLAPTSALNPDPSLAPSRHLTYDSLDFDLIPNTAVAQPEHPPDRCSHSSSRPDPNHSTRSQKLDSMLVYNYCDLDEDEDEVFNFQEWPPKAQEALETLTQCQDDLNLVQTRNSYAMCVIRYCFDPSRAFQNLVTSVQQRSLASEATKQAMLGVAALFRSYNDPSIPPVVLRKHADQLAAAAGKMVQLDMHRPEIPLVMKLAAMSELLWYNYYAGNLVEYYKYLEQATSIVRTLLGPNTLDFHVLSGDETVDIRILAWCDILSAVALSRPTKLSYHFNFDRLLRDNLEGRDTSDGNGGLEWMVGCPDIFTMLMVEVVNLTHSPIPHVDKIGRASKIEATIWAWQVRPGDVDNSVLRMRRMSAQEIWRHTVILYLHKAIYQANPSSEVARKSVKQITNLASILPAGHSPDCLMAVPYFIAGTFSVTPKDRHFFRTRLLKCGNEGYLRVLVVRLDDIWKQADDTGRFTDWSTNKPSNIMF